MVYTKNFSIEMSVIDSVLKANPWIYKTNYLIGEKIIGK